MAYDEQTSKSRVVVQTPASRREVVQTERQYTPEGSGMSAAMVTALVVVSLAVIGLLLLFFMTRSQDDANNNANLAAQQQPPQTTVVQQPSQQPPVIVQQPAPASQPAPIIVNPAPTGGTEAGVPDDGSIRAEIDKRLLEDPKLSNLGITATVTAGRVTLTGKVNTEQLKHQVEKLVRAVRGVKAVDNQIVVVTA
jgi:hypothetical protein